MPGAQINGVRVAGVASAVPDTVLTLADDAAVFGEADAKRVFKNTGVRQRHVTAHGMTAGDLRARRAAPAGRPGVGAGARHRGD